MKPWLCSVSAACLVAALPGIALAQKPGPAPSGGSRGGPLQIGQTIQGQLGQGDRVLTGGEFADDWVIRGRAGQQIRLQMNATGVDTYLLIRGPNNFAMDNDDANGSLNAELVVTLPADGEYSVTATSAAAREAGAYTLVATDMGMSAPAQASGGSGGGGALAVGRSVSGNLAQGDATIQSGEFADAYEIPVAAGERIEFTLEGQGFDPYLMVRGPGDLSEDNDDDAAQSGSTNSRLVVTAPQAGSMRVTATSFQPGETGSYRLSARRPSGGAVASSGGGGGGASGIAQLRPGAGVSGALASGDGQLNSGEWYDDYQITVAQPGQQVTVDLTSQAFDTYLMVAGPNNFTQQNDDGPNGTNAQLSFQAPVAGTYLVRATSFRPGEQGAYSIAMGSGGAMAAAPPRPTAAAASSGTIGVGQTRQGNLAAGDPTRQGGAFVDSWTIAGTPGQRVGISMGGSFDTVLTVISPSGAREQNDDARSGTTDSYLEIDFAETGTYRIEATSFQPGTSGTYRLAVAPVQAAGQTRSASLSAMPVPSAGTRPPPATGNAIGLGQQRQGTLARGDTTLNSGEFIDNYTFQAQRGQTVTIDAVSSAFDTYLLVTPPQGEQIDNDDGPNGTNAQVSFTAPANGTYRIGVTSFRPGESGAYQLRVSQGQVATANSGGGNAARGRVYGVFVGISDYPGGISDLDNTDKDARDLAEALRQTGMLAPQSVILTESQATVGNVTNAIRQVMSQAGPDDTVVVFYSGHGTQSTSTPGARSEPDGRDEELALYDGEMTDDQMAALFANSRAGMSLLVLDSCFSGGFARDVVSRPGVMGLFSSEEDLTSQVAGKFEAGGYLSHFIRLAMSGQADLNGNGAITAGEMSTYLREQFAREGRISASTMDRQNNYQYLVVERGGVKIDDVVMVLR